MTILFKIELVLISVNKKLLDNVKLVCREIQNRNINHYVLVGDKKIHKIG